MSVASTGGKKIRGRKRHILVDTLGHLLAVKVHSAGLVDCLGAPLLLQDQHGRFPRIEHLFADSAYQGDLTDWIKEHLGWSTEIICDPTKKAPPDGKWVWVKAKPVWRPAPKPKGTFLVQRKRWVVERTFAWISHFRRLARDYEGLTSSSEAFIQIAFIRLMLSRLLPF